MVDSKIAPLEKDSSLIAAISCLFGVFIALIIYLVQKEDRFVRFFALQAIVFDIAGGVFILLGYLLLWVVWFGGTFIGVAATVALPASGGLFSIISLAITILGFVAFFGILALYGLTKLLCAYKAFKGEVFKIPKIGDFVEQKI